MGLSIKVPSHAAELLLKEARSRGLHIQDIVLEKLEADLDPKDKAQDYMEISLLLFNEAKQELDKEIYAKLQKKSGALLLLPSKLTRTGTGV